MRKYVWQMPNSKPRLHRLGPIREGLPCGLKIPGSGALAQRKIDHMGQISLLYEGLKLCHDLANGLVNQIKATSLFKSP